MELECYKTTAPPSGIDFEVYSNWWHCDQRRADLQKIFINLTDTSDSDGPFEVFNKQATKELLGYAPFCGREDADFEPDHEFPDMRGRYSHTGPAGSALLANTQECLHRATIPEGQRERNIFLISFEAGKTPSPSFDPELFVSGLTTCHRYTSPSRYGWLS